MVRIDFTRHRNPFRHANFKCDSPEAELSGLDGPFLMGERYSLLDIYLTVLISWHPDPTVLLLSHPRLLRCSRAVTSWPVTERVMREAAEMPTL